MNGDTPVPTHLQQKLDALAPEPAPAHLAERLRVRQSADRLDRLVAGVLPLYRRTVQQRGCVFLAGCGGFSAGAMHMAAELVVRYQRDRAPIRALALGTNPAIVTAAVNDFGPDHALAREFEALARPGDLCVIYSTSGESSMLRELAITAQRLGVPVVAWCPPDSRLAQMATVVGGACDQEMVLMADHAIADRLEREAA